MALLQRDLSMRTFFFGLLLTISCWNSVGVANASICASAHDCLRGRRCVTGYCQDSLGGVCENARQCSSGEMCVNGKCESSRNQICRLASDCGPRFNCMNGRCEINDHTFCVVARDCLFGQYCMNGSCTGEAADDGCRKDLDCRVTEVCELNRCVRRP